MDCAFAFWNRSPAWWKHPSSFQWTALCSWLSEPWIDSEMIKISKLFNLICAYSKTREEVKVKQRAVTFWFLLECKQELAHSFIPLIAFWESSSSDLFWNCLKALCFSAQVGELQLIVHFLLTSCTSPTLPTPQTPLPRPSALCVGHGRSLPPTEEEMGIHCSDGFSALLGFHHCHPRSSICSGRCQSDPYLSSWGSVHQGKGVFVAIGCGMVKLQCEILEALAPPTGHAFTAHTVRPAAPSAGTYVRTGCNL